MEFYKINDKTISKDKIMKQVEQILAMRSHGHSQAEVASYFSIDRTFISRIESLGELRKGKTIALVGFPLSNTKEVKELAKEYGVNLTFVLNEKERWEFLASKTGIELFDQIMELVTEIRKYDVVILLGSDMRIQVLESLLNSEVIAIKIGESPIKKDVFLDIKLLENVLQNLV